MTKELPNFTALIRRAHHGRSSFAAKCLLKLRHVRDGSDHAILGDRMRVALHHEPLSFRTDSVATKLSPGNKELLVGREAVNCSSRRPALLRFLKRQIGNLGSRQITNTFAKDKLAIVMDVGLNEVAIKLPDNAGRAFLEAFEVIGRPPVIETALSIVLGALIVKAVTDFVPDDDADSAVIHGVNCVHAECRRLEDSRGEDNFCS